MTCSDCGDYWCVRFPPQVILLKIKEHSDPAKSKRWTISEFPSMKAGGWCGECLPKVAALN